MTILDEPSSDTKWNSTRGGVNGGIRIEMAFDAEIKILPMKIFKKEVEEKDCKPQVGNDLYWFAPYPKAYSSTLAPG